MLRQCVGPLGFSHAEVDRWEQVVGARGAGGRGWRARREDFSFARVARLELLVCGGGGFLRSVIARW